MTTFLENDRQLITEERVNQLRKDENLGVQLRSRRVDMGMSVENLAVKTGLPTLTVDKIERGVNHPSADTLALLAQALNMDVL
ncbi:helix-turn-helix domain-containing protein [Planococcus salinus]|uniref:XRE family transcriptional regulator n=1 Tax=Planococcus salinus TaxID=1848460 RepID=A0A3M8P8M1_9BACL|nr:helix-turn-helix transcriptional regulator [Planococcus salinus]RNF39544.1 XRE family transcriptional regulator [Planococcus salinus]